MTPNDTPQDAPPGMQPLRPTDPSEVGDYQLRARLGSGGMGTVYLSHSPAGQPVALKVVRHELAEDPDFRPRFEQEVRAARRVQGIYTVPVLDASTQAPPLWLATAYVPGPSLADVVRSHGPLPLSTVLLLVAGVAEALQAIHAAGVVHRDLKPGNVLLAADGPKVIDFGIARAADTTSLTGTDVRVGTPSYMAPERITGTSAQPAADLFTLGLIAHHAATAGHPFGEGAAHAVMYRIVREEPEVGAAPEALRGLIGACLAKDPAARPSPAQVIEACRSLSPGGTLQRQESWLPPALAADITARLRSRIPAPAPAAAPALLATPAAAPATPAPAPPTGQRDAGRRRMALLLAATAVAAAILGGVMATQLFDGGGGGVAGEGQGSENGDGGSAAGEAGGDEPDSCLCVETPEDNVVLLWFKEVTAEPFNQDLRTYLTTATQWAPNP